MALYRFLVALTLLSPLYAKVWPNGVDSRLKFVPSGDEDDDSLNFLVIGDWGGLPTSPYSTAVERAIASRMGKFAAANDVQFVLALGDNFYFDGVNGVDDPRFQETYDNVFRDDALPINWYLIAGNHDHRGNVKAQIEYSSVEKRWKFPNYYYPLQFHTPSGSAKVDVVMVDTVILCGNSDSDYLGLQPHAAENSLEAENQWSWLEAQLQNSKADYLIVAGHYPVFSISHHGPTHCLVRRLLPLLHKYNVSAYFCGHDHNLQHLQYTQYDTTVEYFVSGSANFVDPSRKHESDVPDGSSKFFWADEESLGGFGFVKVTSQQLSFTFYAANGKRLYQQDIRPRLLS